jgi:hypothetical protein
MESRAVMVKGVRHVRCLQDGELFEKMVFAWLEEVKDLEELEVLWSFCLVRVFL